MTDDWERLGEAVRRRRDALGLAQGERPPSSATWRKVEHAIDPPYSTRTTTAICTALRWRGDAFERLLAGDEPVEEIEADATGELTQTVRDLTAEVRLLRHALRQGGIGPGVQ